MNASVPVDTVKLEQRLSCRTENRMKNRVAFHTLKQSKSTAGSTGSSATLCLIQNEKPIIQIQHSMDALEYCISSSRKIESRSVDIYSLEAFDASDDVPLEPQQIPSIIKRKYSLQPPIQLPTNM